MGNRAIANMLSQNADFISLMSKWDQACQMRKFTQTVKTTISDELEQKLEKKIREELTLLDPLRQPFTGMLDQEQQEDLDRRLAEQLKVEFEARVKEIIKKARFLLTLSVPEDYMQA